MDFKIPLNFKMPVKIKIEPTDDNSKNIDKSNKVHLNSVIVQNNPGSEPVNIKIEPQEVHFEQPSNIESLRAEIKKEYSSDEESTKKSLVLRFKRDKNGNYSVIPLIKPDPFFEEQIDDVSDGENNSYSIKMEQTYPSENKYLDNPIKLESKDSFIEENYKHKQIKPGDDFIQCKFCSYIHTEVNVKKHVNRVHATKIISCPFCGEKSCKGRDSLDAHLLKKHSNSADAIAMIRRKIWKCQVCQYKTIARSNFTRHLITHENKLENSSVKRLSTIQKDIRKAVEKKVQYNCHHCSYGTYDKGAITKHVRIHKGKNYMPHKCSACNQTFNEMKSLNTHILKRHYDNEDVISPIRDKILKCDYCNYRDVSKTKILRHKSGRHIKKERRGRKMIIA